jgi:predicted peptidase
MQLLSGAGVLKMFAPCLRVSVATAILLLAAPVTAQQLPQARGQHRLKIEVADAGPVLFGVSVPEGYASSTPAPLVLVLHPGGPRVPYYGAQFMRDIVEPALRQLRAIMIAPDCVGRDWADAACEKPVMSLIADAKRDYNIDRTRVLVVGFSMGGRGAWQMAAKHRELFTAAIPMAASARNITIDQLGHQPTYIIHSREDEVVPFEPAQELAGALKKLNRDVHFEAIDGLTHFEMASYVYALRDAGRWLASRWKD